MAKPKSIPAPPWTVENVGEEEYCRLANEYGCFNPSMEAADYRPPLDLMEVYNKQQGAQPPATAKTATEV
jgi:hypothetical protein